MHSVERQMEILCRGIVDLHVKAELEERLASGKPLRVKAGFDPTRPDLHLGHTVLMQKMRQFQDLGHQVIFIIGDFTAMVGDPTGRNELRPSLTREDVMSAAATYQEQAFKILDKDRTIVRYNSEWLDKTIAVAGLAPSRSEGANMIKGGTVRADGEVVKDAKAKLAKGKTYEVQVGSKNREFARLAVV